MKNNLEKNVEILNFIGIAFIIIAILFSSKLKILEYMSDDYTNVVIIGITVTLGLLTFCSIFYPLIIKKEIELKVNKYILTKSQNELQKILKNLASLQYNINELRTKEANNIREEIKSALDKIFDMKDSLDIFFHVNKAIFWLFITLISFIIGYFIQVDKLFYLIGITELNFIMIEIYLLWYAIFKVLKIVYSYWIINDLLN